MRSRVQSLVILAILLMAGLAVARSDTFSGMTMRESRREWGRQADFPPKLEEEVQRFIKKRPRLSAEKITAYANSVLQRSGYLYEFEIRDLIQNNKLQLVDSGRNIDDVEKLYLIPFDLEGGALKVILTQTPGFFGSKARKVIRHRYSRFRRRGFGLKSPQKLWPARSLKYRISPKTRTTVILDTGGSA
jgi:hypothetical protein